MIGGKVETKDTLLRGNQVSTVSNDVKETDISLLFNPVFLIESNGKYEVSFNKNFLRFIVKNEYFGDIVNLSCLKIDEDLVPRLGKQLLSAMKHIHDQGYSGIELQLGNIYLDDKNNISIIKFEKGFLVIVLLMLIH